MSTITYKYKNYFCPMWEVSIPIKAKYRYDDENNPYISTYATWFCPILEEIGLPDSERKEEYFLFRYCRKQSECKASSLFDDKIDDRD